MPTQITLRSDLSRGLSISEYDGNLLSYESRISELRGLVDSCCGTQSWTENDSLTLRSDYSSKLSISDADQNLSLLYDKMSELNDKIFLCCGTASSIDVSLVFRSDLQRNLKIFELDSNFIMLRDFIDDLFEIQEDCCSGPPEEFILTEGGDPILTENDLNLIIE